MLKADKIEISEYGLNWCYKRFVEEYKLYLMTKDEFDRMEHHKLYVKYYTIYNRLKKNV